MASFIQGTIFLVHNVFSFIKLDKSKGITSINKQAFKVDHWFDYF